MSYQTNRAFRQRSATRRSRTFLSFFCLSALPRWLLPGIVILASIAAMLIHGPIGQLSDYHHFADQRRCFNIPFAADVLSNLIFGIVGAYGLRRLWLMRDISARFAGRSGYALFFFAIFFTAFGSAWYHLAPDNSRLVWDRLPIALACAGLLTAVWHETVGGSRWLVLLLAGLAIASVAWWRHTDLQGMGDLRPYLLLQLLPLVLIPLLQWQFHVPSRERMIFAVAIGLYLLAKVCELADHVLFETFMVVSGHTLKHLFAGLAAAVIASLLSQRQNAPAA